MAGCTLFVTTLFVFVCGSIANSKTIHDPIGAGHTLDTEAGASPWSHLPSLANAVLSLLPFQTQPITSSLPPAEEVPQGDGWEARFARGLRRSKALVEVSEQAVGRWVADSQASGAGVPEEMMLAEELLAASEEAPTAQQKAKTAERALRMYNHAKWLAERNLARAAQWRYREASRLAQQSKRSVLAAHALSRLGYFLMEWRRFGEALEVLQESESLSRKSNPLAPFLIGVLERQSAGPDAERLRLAEDRILNAQEQPSDELEAKRVQLVTEILFWRSATESPQKCLAATDVAQVLACLLGHAAYHLHHAFVPS